MKKRYIVLAAANGLSAVFFLIFTVMFLFLRGSLPESGAAEKWSGNGTPYAFVNVYTEEDTALSVNAVYTARVNIDKKLKENSISSQKENARLWADAFSSPQEKTELVAGRNSSEAMLTVTGGDFFLFHPQDMLYGSGYSDDALMQDVVVIDETLAWRLYGATDIAGKPVQIGTKYYFIAGVFRQSEDNNVEKVYGGKPRVFMSYKGYELLGREARFNCYEACLPNSVGGLAMGIFKDALALEEESSEFVEWSDRYSFKNRFGIIKNFGMRSVEDGAVYYPYWENAARITEDKSALLLVLQGLGLVIPVGTAAYLIIKLVRNRKKLLKKAIDAVKSILNKIKNKRGAVKKDGKASEDGEDVKQSADMAKTKEEGHR